jgi:predicted PurR-regulated permease PerM
VILVYILLLALLTGFLLLLFPLIVEQGSMIAAALPGYYQSLHEGMGSYPNQLIVRLSEFLPRTLPGLQPLQQTTEQMLASTGWVSTLLDKVSYAWSSALWRRLSACSSVCPMPWCWPS